MMQLTERIPKVGAQNTLVRSQIADLSPGYIKALFKLHKGIFKPEKVKRGWILWVSKQKKVFDDWKDAFHAYMKWLGHGKNFVWHEDKMRVGAAIDSLCEMEHTLNDYSLVEGILTESDFTYRKHKVTYDTVQPAGTWVEKVAGPHLNRDRNPSIVDQRTKKGAKNDIDKAIEQAYKGEAEKLVDDMEKAVKGVSKFGVFEFALHKRHLMVSVARGGQGNETVSNVLAKNKFKDTGKKVVGEQIYQLKNFIPY